MRRATDARRATHLTNYKLPLERNLVETGKCRTADRLLYRIQIATSTCPTAFESPSAIFQSGARATALIKSRSGPIRAGRFREEEKRYIQMKTLPSRSAVYPRELTGRYFYSRHVPFILPVVSPLSKGAMARGVVSSDSHERTGKRPPPPPPPLVEIPKVMKVL